MFNYYLQLGFRSLRRNPVLTTLMVTAIGFGVAASMTTYAIFRAMSSDPIPWKSSKLYVPQIDVWGPNSLKRDGEPPDAMTYVDAVFLMNQHRAPLQSAVYPIEPTIYPDNPRQKPRSVHGHAVFAEFFAMLDMPFVYGRPWSADDDKNHRLEAVIGNSLNQRLFGGADSVGREIRVNGHTYRVIGVLGHWNPQPRFYDLGNIDAFGSAEQIFVPFTTAIDQELETSGRFSCGIGKLPDPGFAGNLTSTCVWIGFMVELDSALEVGAYRVYLENYAKDQQSTGRFGWSPNTRLRNVPDWLTYQNVISPVAKISTVLAFCLLLVCMVNTIGLVLAKLLRRSNEIGVRRALGAGRWAIASQFVVESGLIGLAGGLLGSALTWLGVLTARSLLPRQVAVLTHIDLALLWQTLMLAIISTILAGAYPVWRATNIRPALQLKID